MVTGSRQITVTMVAPGAMIRGKSIRISKGQISNFLVNLLTLDGAL